jgi:hypothetical protein
VIVKKCNSDTDPYFVVVDDGDIHIFFFLFSWSLLFNASFKIIQLLDKRLLVSIKRPLKLDKSLKNVLIFEHERALVETIEIMEVFPYYRHLEL